MKKIIYYSLLLACAALYSCEKEFAPLVSLGLDDEYILPRMKTLYFQPELRGKAYLWTMKTKDGRDSVLTQQKDYIFIESEPGTYHLNFTIVDPETPVNQDITIYVVEEQVSYSPYIASVYEYRPAPGQFVNKMPEYLSGDTAESMRRKAEESIRGDVRNGVSLGGFGGYATFGFDHSVMNIEGERDFYIEGNAFYGAAVGDGVGGSSEPGIILVSFDENQNGKPDDTWYEIDWHPEYTRQIVQFGYTLTYHRPDPNKIPEPGMGAITDKTYIRWTDNLGKEGYVMRNVYHKQDYFPGWLKGDKLEYVGTRLPNNAYDISGNGTYFVQYVFPKGAYVDHYPNEALDDDGENRSHFDIDWAVDIKTRERVHLKAIDFIRVYTAQNQYCGWLGETSTEIYLARDLHIR